MSNNKRGRPQIDDTEWLNRIADAMLVNSKLLVAKAIRQTRLQLACSHSERADVRRLQRKWRQHKLQLLEAAQARTIRYTSNEGRSHSTSRPVAGMVALQTQLKPFPNFINSNIALNYFPKNNLHSLSVHSKIYKNLYYSNKYDGYINLVSKLYLNIRVMNEIKNIIFHFKDNIIAPFSGKNLLINSRSR